MKRSTVTQETKEHMDYSKYRRMNTSKINYFYQVIAYSNRNVVADILIINYAKSYWSQ